MNHDDIRRHDLIDRYVMGSLPPDEAERFEVHFLHCEDCLEQLEVAEKLQRGFKGLAAQEVAKASVMQQLGLLAWFSRLGRSRQISILASTVAVVAMLLLPGSYFHHELSALRQQLEGHQESRQKLAEALRRAHQPQVNTAVFPLHVERGSLISSPETVRSVVRLSREPEWIVLSLELDRPNYPSYRVRLLRSDETTEWQDEGFIPDYLDALVLSLHSSFLKTGDHVALVEADLPNNETVEIGTYPFRVIREE